LPVSDIIETNNAFPALEDAVATAIPAVGALGILTCVISI
jgi:hypothetical protein